MSFQQGLVVIVTSIKCLYIYFLRNSTKFPHPDLFDKFKTYWQQNYCKSSERVTGPIKKDSCLIQIIYFAKKKKEETFFQPQTMASTPPQLRWGHWRGCPEIWQNRTKLAPKKNSKSPLSIIQLYTRLLCHRHIHSCLSLQKDKRNHYISGPVRQIPPLLQCLH